MTARRFVDTGVLATLAAQARLSPHYFCRAFKQSFGVPPHRYHTSRRIEEAKTLLAKPSSSVTEIGLTMGFQETSSFTVAFHRTTGSDGLSAEPALAQRLEDQHDVEAHDQQRQAPGAGLGKPAERAAGGEPHVDAGDRLGEREVGLRHLARPAAVLDALGGVVERGPVLRQSADIGCGRRYGIGKLPAMTGFCGPGSTRLRGFWALIAPCGGRSGLPKVCAFTLVAAPASKPPAADAANRARRENDTILVASGSQERRPDGRASREA